MPSPFPCTGPGGTIVRDNSCLQQTGFDPAASSTWGQYRNPKGNCTNYVAYRLDRNGAANFLKPGEGNAIHWKKHAEAAGKTVNGTPAVGSVAWWDGSGTNAKSRFGHVAYVEKVEGSGANLTVYLSESHWDGDGIRGGSRRLVVKTGDAKSWPDAFLHIKDQPANPLSQYIGQIVQWSGDKKAQKTAWLVGPDLRRRWIPDIATYNCLKARGAPGPTKLPASILDKLKDLTGVRATCTPPPPPAAVLPPPPEPTPTPVPPPPDPKSTPPPPPPRTVSLAKGASAQGQSGCVSSYCRFLTVSFKNFSSGTHTIVCRASGGYEGGFYTYQRSGSSGTTSYCYYGFPGRTVWVTVDGVSSNRITW
ncbi:MAG TPA: CHAP domain-containing protein [Solirubrobacterales bacterium]|nr:CHAP domain-containing protein [Solirubrobacterales bacterium]